MFRIQTTFPAVVAVLLCVAASVMADAIWTNDSTDSTWGNTQNWLVDGVQALPTLTHGGGGKFNGSGSSGGAQTIEVDIANAQIKNMTFYDSITGDHVFNSTAGNGITIARNHRIVRKRTVNRVWRGWGRGARMWPCKEKVHGQGNETRRAA